MGVDVLDDGVLSLVVRFVQVPLWPCACAHRRFAALVPEVVVAVVEDAGFHKAPRDVARAAYALFLLRRSSPPLRVEWTTSYRIDARAAVDAVEDVKSRLSSRRAGPDVDSKIVCARLDDREATLRFLGERWRLRLERRGAIRATNASASRFSHVARLDDDELSLELQLLPVSRCYPNCNCRYDGRCHIALLFQHPATGQTTLLKKSINITGCYTWAALYEPEWRDVHNTPPDLSSGRTLSSNLVFGVHCTTGWENYY